MTGAAPVVILAQWVYAFELVSPVIRELRRRGVPVEVAVVPERLPGDEYDTRGAQQLHGALSVEGWAPLPLVPPEEEAARIRSLDPCAVFLPTPYDLQRHPSMGVEAWGMPLHAVEYFHRVAPDTVEGGATTEAFYDACQAVYCGSRGQLQAFVDSGLDPRVAVLTGHPGLDRWDVPRAPAAEPTVMWCPWHVDRWADGRRGYCTLVQARADMVAAMGARPEIRFIVRPHPLAFEDLLALGSWTLADERAFRDELAALPNVELVDANVTSPEDQIASSWAMVTDGLSFLAEYAYTGKPLLLTEAPGHPGWTPDGQSLRAIVDTALVDGGVPGLEDFLDRVAAGPDPAQQSAQRDAVARVLHRPPGGSASAVADHLVACRRRSLDRRRGVRRSLPRLPDDVLVSVADIGRPEPGSGLPRYQREILMTGQVPWCGGRVAAGAMGGPRRDDQVAVVLDDEAGSVLLTGGRIDGWAVERVVHGDTVFDCSGDAAGKPLGVVAEVLGQIVADRLRLVREGLSPAGAPRRLLIGSGSAVIDVVTVLPAIASLEDEIDALVDSGRLAVNVWPGDRTLLDGLGGMPALLGPVARHVRDWPRAWVPHGVVPLAASRVSGAVRARLRTAWAPAPGTGRPRLWVGLPPDGEDTGVARFVDALTISWSRAGGGEVLVGAPNEDVGGMLVQALAADVALALGASPTQVAVWLAGVPTLAVAPAGAHHESVLAWFRARTDDPPSLALLPEDLLAFGAGGVHTWAPEAAPEVVERLLALRRHERAR